MWIIRQSQIALHWLGSQGTRAVAAIVALGIILPDLGAFFKPYLTEAVFLLLCMAFLRLDTRELRHSFQRPLLLITAIIWTSLVVPAFAGLLCTTAKMESFAPGLYPGMMLQAIACPIMASPALAAIMGLDATLVLLALIGSTALLPLTAPLFSHLFLGASVTVAPADLALRLLLLISCAAATGLLVSKLLGKKWIQEKKTEIDGVNILILLVFMAVLMEGIGPAVFDRPLVLLGLLGAAIAAFFLLFTVTLFCFLPCGRDKALSLAYMSAQRNMGLMLAVTGNTLPELTWLYFALSQFPIYLSPQLLKPFKRKLLNQKTS